MAKSKNNFYAVKSGRIKGIYNNWQDCQKNIIGFSGALFKGFETLGEAEDYMSDVNRILEKTREPIDESQLEYPVAYVDGSYDNKRSMYSFGVVLLLPSHEIIKLKGKGNNKEAAVERNVAGELMGAMTAIKYAYENNYKKILIKHDYEGIARWAQGDWKAKKFCSNQYLKFLKKYENDMEITFQKVPAHSGVLYNEIADKLAKDALLP